MSEADLSAGSAGVPSNPYAPPIAQQEFEPLDGRLVLATRGARLVATILDGLVYCGAFVIPMPLFGLTPRLRADTLTAMSAAMITWFVSTFLLVTSVWAYQTYLVATTGQSLGKRWRRIRIVRVDGTPAGFVGGVLLRSWGIGLASAVPFLGPLIALADVLWIFGPSRRCLHDYVAGTVVVLDGTTT